MGLLIKLTRPELSHCKQAAALRWQLARASGVVNQRRDHRSDADIDYLGIRAETAVAKAYGLPYTPSALGIDEGVDMYAGDISIDVKATFHTEGRLLLKSKDAAKADLFIMVSNTPEDDVMNLLGWTSRTRFLEQCQETDFGKGVCFTMEQDQLYSVSSLWLHITSKTMGVAA